MNWLFVRDGLELHERRHIAAFLLIFVFVFLKFFFRIFKNVLCFNVLRIRFQYYILKIRRRLL